MAVTVEWDAAEIKTPEHDRLVLYLLNNPLCIFNKAKTESVVETGVETEVPVMNGSFIIGYLDVVITIETRVEKDHTHNYTCHESHYSVGCESCERLCTLTKEYWPNYSRYVIEVKPKVTNFGDLVRQINKYKVYSKNATWLVYTEECTPEIDAALASQKILVVRHKQK